MAWPPSMTCAGSPSPATITTTYDRLNRPAQVTVSGDSAATTNYSYSFTSPTWSDASGAYTATVDKFGRETGLLDPIHGATPWTSVYRADGQQASLAAPNGNTTTWKYDDAGRPKGSLTEDAGGTDRADYLYGLNRAGQRLSEYSAITGDPTNGTANFTYDALGRLTGYSGTPITTQTYTWDQVANRLTKQVGGGTAVTMTYNDANRPTSDSAGNSYTSDLDGRLTGQVGQTLVWDSLGRLTQVKDPITSANISTYTYDALDRLLTVSNGSGLTKFRYVGTTKQIAQARDLNNTLLYNVATSWAGGARMDFGAGGSNQRYYGVNGHGDLTWTASSTGTVTATLRSDPWGTPGTTSGGSLPSFRFQGSWFDTSAALSWAVTRWYAPALGRFVSEDSLLGKPAAPASRHLFAYGAGDPVGRWDPNGTDWWNSGIWVSYPERTTAWEEFTWSSIFGIALKVSTIACSMAGVVGVFTVNPALAAIGVACSVGGVVGDVLGKRFADSTKEHKWISRKMWYRIDNVNKVYAIRWEYTPYTLFDGVDEDGLPDWIKVKARWPLKIEWRRFNMEHFGWCISSKNVMWYHCDRWGWKTTRFYYPASTGYRTEMDYQAITANQY